nr:MAG TPA: hypothetical protein [Caudoviricetes sp.]
MALRTHFFWLLAIYFLYIDYFFFFFSSSYFSI